MTCHGLHAMRRSWWSKWVGGQGRGSRGDDKAGGVWGVGCEISLALGI